MQNSHSPESLRQCERHHIKLNALVHCRGQFQTAKVINFSAGGLQLEGTFGLIAADQIEIEFISGVRLPGRVAWSLGAQTGVVFLATLPPDHPAWIELGGMHSGARSSTLGAPAATAVDSASRADDADHPR